MEQPAGASRASRLGGVVRVLGVDVAAPLAVFWVARAGDVPVVWALVLSGLPPLLGVLLDWGRWHDIDVVGGVVLGGIALSVVLALITDDPRGVLLGSVALTAAFGVTCCVSTRVGPRPLIFSFAQAFYGGPRAQAGADLDAEYEEHPEARSFWRSTTWVWGVVYTVEAAVRLVAVLAAPTALALALNRVLPWLVYLGLLGWTFWRGARARASGSGSEAAGVDAATPDAPSG